MRLAAIDLGSNSFRLEIAKVEDGEIFSEGSWKDTVRLAAGLDAKGNLTEEAQKKALDALARIAEKIRGFPRSQIRAVGTQTLRAAHNSAEFIQKAEAVLDCPVEILRGKEEARLVFEGCSFALPVSDKKRLIVDIGGASTECVVGKEREVLVAESFHIGCVTTSVNFFTAGKISKDRFEKAILAAEAELEVSLKKFESCRWDEAYGSSGTVAAVSQILHDTGLSDGEINLNLLQKLKQAIIEAGEISKLHFAGLKEDRREVLAGGVSVLIAVFNKLKIDKMLPVGGALRYGLLYDLAGRKLDRDPRANSVLNLVKRINVDVEQAQRVSGIAVKLLKNLDPEINPELVKQLEWSGYLHEIGLSVSRSDYHKHSEYLIRNSDIPGFSRSEQEKMAMIVLGQRGNLKKVGNFLDSPKMAELIFCLRLAVIFSHARTDQDLPAIQFALGKKSFTVSLPSSWLKSHPLSEYMLTLEKDIWSKVNYKVELLAR